MVWESVAAGRSWRSVSSPEHIELLGEHTERTGTSAGHVCGYCRRGSERTGAGTFGEHAVGTETRIKIGISKQEPSGLFACRWLRGRRFEPATTPLI